MKKWIVLNHETGMFTEFMDYTDCHNALIANIDSEEKAEVYTVYEAQQMNLTLKPTFGYEVLLDSPRTKA